MAELEDDNIFLRELRNGYSWQLWAALQFLKSGFGVRVPALKVRPDHDSIDDYSDDGDLIVSTKRKAFRFECKSRNIEFNNPADYPFDTAFVDRVKTWHRKGGRKPTAILLISQITGEILVIPRSTENTWVKQTSLDSVRHYERDYYMVGKNHLRSWPELVDWLRLK